MNAITVRVDDDIEKDMPETVRMRVTAEDRGGKKHEVHIVNPLGHELNPLSPADIAAKFTGLTQPRLGAVRAAEALKAWQSIETASDLKAAFDAVAVARAPETGRSR